MNKIKLYLVSRIKLSEKNFQRDSYNFITEQNLNEKEFPYHDEGTEYLIPDGFRLDNKITFSNGITNELNWYYLIDKNNSLHDVHALYKKGQNLAYIDSDIAKYNHLFLQKA